MKLGSRLTYKRLSSMRDREIANVNRIAKDEYGRVKLHNDQTCPVERKIKT